MRIAGANSSPQTVSVASDFMTEDNRDASIGASEMQVFYSKTAALLREVCKVFFVVLEKSFWCSIEKLRHHTIRRLSVPYIHDFVGSLQKRLYEPNGGATENLSNPQLTGNRTPLCHLLSDRSNNSTFSR